MPPHVHHHRIVVQPFSEVPMRKLMFCLWLWQIRHGQWLENVSW